MSVHEECGVFGVISEKPIDVAKICYYGLYALQHRGQESCGIVVNDDGLFVSHKDVGLVSEVFSKDVLNSFPEGSMAVAHTRYGTTGGANRNNCQPIEVNHQKGRMAIAHNGNLSNAAELRSKLELSGAIFHTSSDTETIAYIVTKERLTAPSIEEAVSRAMNTLQGAYSLVLMSAQKLICARSLWIPTALLWKNERRDVRCGVGKLRFESRRRRVYSRRGTGRNNNFRQRWDRVPQRALQKCK